MQTAIREAGFDAWVLYDFRGSNDLAWDILALDKEAHCTRRWMVVIPAKGKAHKIVHRMEQIPLSHVDAKETAYSTTAEYTETVRTLLAPYKKVAMEYSPMNAIPVVSRVDAGTVEMIRSFGNEVVSSGDILQRFTSVLAESQLAGAAVTGGHVRDAIFEGFALIRERILDDESITEYEVQRHIVEGFRKRNMITDTDPIVAIGRNAASPHYAPSVTGSSVIDRDMVVVIDAWAQHDGPGAVFGDLTWVGYTGDEVPADVERTFEVIVRARDAALDLVRSRFESGTPIAGYEVDRAARDVINEAGLGSNFIHRTGHNITTEIHGPGVNMDDFETHDSRLILKGMSFSIEPGVYFEDSLGLRTEIDVIVSHKGQVEVPSSPMQTTILPLLAEDWQQ